MTTEFAETVARNEV